MGLAIPQTAENTRLDHQESPQARLPSCVPSSGELNPEELVRAERAVLWSLGEPDITATLDNYRIAEALREGDVLTSRIRDSISKFARTGLTLSPSVVARYDAAGMMRPERDAGYLPEQALATRAGVRIARIHQDAPYSIILRFDGVPNGIISFCLDESRALFIEQIQGINLRFPDTRERDTARVSQPKGLFSLHWPDVLISSVAQLGKELGFDALGLRSARTHAGVSRGGKLSVAQATRLHDEPAERLNFERLPNGNFSKKLDVA